MDSGGAQLDGNKLREDHQNFSEIQKGSLKKVKEQQRAVGLQFEIKML